MARPTEFDVFVIGEALVDVVRRGGEPERRHVGGSPANVALGLARLGRTVRLATELGADTDADLIRARLTGAGVDVTATATGTGRTATATADLDEHGSASYAFDLSWSIPITACADTRAAITHVGSIAAVLEPGASTVRQRVAADRDVAMVTYDPNLRPAVIGDADDTRPSVERLVAGADVVKASAEDLAWLYPSMTAEGIARTWVTSGPQVVVVTDGAADIVVVHGPAVHHVTTRQVDVVDTVGAGDAFMAGLIDGLFLRGASGPGARARLAALDTGSVLDTVRRAALAAAITVARRGADPPMAHDLDRARGRGTTSRS